MKKQLLKKRCDKCSAEGEVPSRVRRCHMLERNLLGKTGYYCWGKLVVVKSKPKKATGRCAFCKTPLDRSDGPAVFAHNASCVKRIEFEAAEAEKRKKKRPQEIAAAKLAALRLKIEEKRTARRRLELAISRLEKKAVRLESRAAMTDEQVAARRQQRLDRKKRNVRRGIKIVSGAGRSE